MENENKLGGHLKKGLGLGIGGCAGIVIFVVILIVISVVSSGDKSSDQSSTTNTNSSTAPSSTTAPTPAAGKVEVKSHQLKTVYGTKQVVGEVVNNTGGNVSFVKVTATFYDKAGDVTGTDFTYAGDTASTPLLAGATTPFTVTALDGNIVIDHYKLDITWN
ncbi:MAG: FxLYD domain-containing protein [Patescibacteria group bacterium]|mgnify:CR=1 FL=1